MEKFMDENFLLSTGTARKLYHEYAKEMPILDYHCHIHPKEIYEDRKFDNLTQIWLEGDHYKWRLMRANGIEEKYITGDAADEEKFEKWAQTLEMAIGNPLYHWSCLELKRYFGYEGYLCADTAKEVWNFCNKKLAGDDMSVRNIIRKSNVSVIGTTDDPADSLIWHRKIAQDDTFGVQVFPSWRPDRAMNLEKPDYTGYIKKLGEISGRPVHSFAGLKEALRSRMDAFEASGCRVADHGLEYVMYVPADERETEAIFKRRMEGKIPLREEELKFKTAFMLAMGREYNKRNWVMQIHYGCRRDNNTLFYEKLGADSGFDCINNSIPVSPIADFMDALAKTDELPKMILYSLNPNDNAALGTLTGCFQNAKTVGRIQQGSAWWFNDNKSGMNEHMTALANQGLLGNFIGMLTDSRSFLSYTRHEYFRRIMCELIGNWVEQGEYPADFTLLERIVKGIAYNNAERYFEFTVK